MINDKVIKINREDKSEKFLQLLVEKRTLFERINQLAKEQSMLCQDELNQQDIERLNKLFNQRQVLISQISFIDKLLNTVEAQIFKKDLNEEKEAEELKIKGEIKRIILTVQALDEFMKKQIEEQKHSISQNLKQLQMARKSRHLYYKKALQGEGAFIDEKK